MIDPMLELELLQRARARLLQADGWCQGTPLRVVGGVEQVCAVGALLLAVWRRHSTGAAWTGPEVQSLCNRLNRVAERSYPEWGTQSTFFGLLPLINDRLGLDAVLQVYDAAILELAAEIQASAESRLEVPV